MQTQHTAFTELRSEAIYHWDTDGVRPSARECAPNASGLLPGDLGLAARVPLTEERRMELRSGLDGAAPRLSLAEQTEFDEIFAELCEPTPPTELPLPEHRWTFASERGDEPAPTIVQHGNVQLRPYSVFHNQNEEIFAREQRMQRGHCENHVQIGYHVAYTTNYTPETPINQQNEFWLGFVTDLDPANNCIRVRRKNTLCMKNATNGQNAKYKLWMARPHHEWIEASRALCQFEHLTDENRIKAKYRRRIKNALELEMVEAQEQREREANNIADE